MGSNRMDQVKDSWYVQHLLEQGYKQVKYFVEPEEKVNGTLTAGILRGEGKISEHPLVFSKIHYLFLNSELLGLSEASKPHSNLSVSIYYCGDQVQGYAGVLHGGMIATMLDEAMYKCTLPFIFSRGSFSVGMTKYLNITYNKLVPTNEYLVVKCKIVNIKQGRKYTVVGTIETLSGQKGSRKVYVEAEGLFIEPKSLAEKL